MDLLAVKEILVLLVMAGWFWAQVAQNYLGVQVLPKYPTPKLVQEQIVALPQLEVASESAEVLIDLPKTRAIYTDKPVPWGTTEKIEEHIYRTYVGSDGAMGTPEEILKALNAYRHTHGIGADLGSDEPLCQLAKERAETQERLGDLDKHKGLEDYMSNPDHWKDLNIYGIGENASYGYILSGVHLIEWVFDADSEHRENQLNSTWNLACAGVAGKAVDIIFGKR